MTDDTTSSGNLISVRLPSFTGVKTDFVIWECKFKARARYYGYASIMNGNVANVHSQNTMQSSQKQKQTATLMTRRI